MGQVDQSLVTFQSGLLGVEREMLPIYKLTEKLRETQRNIDVCVYELRRINENFVAAQTVRR
jgi:exocyst complex component 7